MLRFSHMTERREARPDGAVESEQPYKMNLLTNREAVIEALIAMEGRDWYEKHQPSWGKNSIDGALEKAQRERAGVIYGFGGYHRYIIRPDGRVFYSESHGPREAEQAKEFGFEFN